MKNVINNQYHECVGCGACAQVCSVKCIEMKVNSEGFWYPEIDEDKCINCGKCKKVCPINKKYDKNNNQPLAYGAINKDESIRKKSSSGGMFSVFANYFLKNNGVIIGSVFDNNMKLKHIAINSLDELEKMRGSKYLQSDIGDVYNVTKKIILNGSKVMFVGTPCQVAGLYSFLGSDYEKLFTCDFVCHGVSSPGIFKEYLLNIEKKAQSKVTNVIFRDKLYGWKKPSTVILFDNFKKEIHLSKKDSFSLAFSRNFILRPSCYNCKFSKIPRIADLTFADFWGIDKYYPEFYDNKGTSLLLINNKKSKKLFDLCSDEITFKEVEIEKALENNRNAIGSVKEPIKRKQYFEDLNNYGYKYVEKKYMKPTPFLLRVILKILRMIKINY